MIFKVEDVIDGRYRVRDLIGSGGTGVVYRAYDEMAHREVAIKVINATLTPTRSEREHFVRQVRVVRRLEHPNIARIYGDGLDRARPFVAMELLDGVSLRKIIDLRKEQGQVFSIEEIQPIFQQLALALDFAHRTILHGNLKPDNVIVLPDLLKITDFVLSSGLPRKSFVAVQRQRGAAYYYLAPEIRQGTAPLSPASDIYSLGVVLGEMLTGLTFDEANPRPFQRACRNINKDLRDLILDTLMLSPEARPSSAGELLRRLTGVVPYQAQHSESGAEAGSTDVVVVRPEFPPSESFSALSVEEGMIEVSRWAENQTVRGRADKTTAHADGVSTDFSDAHSFPMVSEEEATEAELGLEAFDQSVAVSVEDHPLMEEPGLVLVPAAERARIDAQKPEPKPRMLRNLTDDLRSASVIQGLGGGGPTTQNDASGLVQPAGEFSLLDDDEEPAVTQFEARPFYAHGSTYLSDLSDELVIVDRHSAPVPSPEKVSTHFLSDNEVGDFGANDWSPPNRANPPVPAASTPLDIGPLRNSDKASALAPMGPPLNSAPLPGGPLTGSVPVLESSDVPGFGEVPPPSVRGVESLKKRERPMTRPRAAALQTPMLATSGPMTAGGPLNSISTGVGSRTSDLMQAAQMPLRPSQAPPPSYRGQAWLPRIGALIVLCVVFVGLFWVVQDRRRMIVEHERALKRKTALLEAARDREEKAREQTRILKLAAREAALAEAAEREATKQEEKKTAIAEVKTKTDEASKSKSTSRSQEKSKVESKPQTETKPKSPSRAETRSPSARTRSPQPAPSPRTELARVEAKPRSAIRKPPRTKDPTPTSGSNRTKPKTSDNTRQLASIIAPPSSSDDGDTCSKGMVLVTGGAFMLGASEEDPERAPEEEAFRSVDVGPFCIDYYEYPNGRGRQPSTAVSHDEASARCILRGKRLCTEQEWEKACKGPGGFRYPYGNTWSPSRCNTRNTDGQDRDVAGSGTFRTCRSGYNVYDMGGNVAEWTSTAEGASFIVKGGASNRPGHASRCSSRIAHPSGSKGAHIGFRCCALPR